MHLGFSGLHFNLCAECHCDGARAELATPAAGYPLQGEAARGRPAVLPAAWPLARSRAQSSCFLGSNVTLRKVFAIGKKCFYSFCFVDAKYLPGCSRIK